MLPAGEREDRPGQRGGSVARQVVAAVGEARPRRRPQDRPTGGPNRARPGRPPWPGPRRRRRRARRSAASSVARVSSGRYSKIASTDRSSAWGRMAGTTWPAGTSTTVARAAALLVGIPARDVPAAPVVEVGVDRAEHLRRLGQIAQELGRGRAGLQGDILPAAVDQDEAGAAVPELGGRPGRDHAAEAVADQHDPAPGRPAAARAARSPRRRRRHRRPAWRGRTGRRRVRQAVSAQVQRRPSGRRRAAAGPPPSSPRPSRPGRG